MNLAFIPGDGIGKDVTAEARRVLDAVAAVFGLAVRVETLPWSADHYLATGVTIPADGYAMLRDQFDAVFVGALGDPRVPDNRHARDVDFVVFRENTEGLYVNIGGRFKAGTEDEIAIQEEVNTWKGVHRIIRHAFEFAQATGRSRVCMADKSNALTHGHALWQRVFREVAADYPLIDATHLYVDALAMFMIRDPAQFEVIVTNNLFGDIVTDIGAELQGGLGMAASANLHPGKTSLFEPVHGSAPPLAGKNVANPFGACLSLALMLDVLGHAAPARAIESAVESCVSARGCTSDIGGHLGTHEATDMLIAQIQSS